MTELLANDYARELLLALLGSGALIALLNDDLAALAQRLPVVGGVAAPLVRRLSPHFAAWLRGEVARSAEQVVLEIEAQAIKKTERGVTKAVLNVEKKAAALRELRVREPGLTAKQRDEEIERALERLKADAAMHARRVVEGQRLTKGVTP